MENSGNCAVTTDDRTVRETRRNDQSLEGDAVETTDHTDDMDNFEAGPAIGSSTSEIAWSFIAAKMRKTRKNTGK